MIKVLKYSRFAKIIEFFWWFTHTAAELDFSAAGNVWIALHSFRIDGLKVSVYDHIFLLKFTITNWLYQPFHLLLLNQFWYEVRWVLYRNKERLPIDSALSNFSYKMQQSYTFYSYSYSVQQTAIVYIFITVYMYIHVHVYVYVYVYMYVYF